MTEVFLLGSFYYLESDIDFYNAEIQRQIEKICASLILFRPEKVAVEAPVSAQYDVNVSYGKLQLAYFNSPEKMKNSELGKIKIFGCEYPITYKNEAVQIGYRIAKLLNHKTVCAIDDDTILDDSVFKYLNCEQENKYNNLLSKIRYTGKPNDLTEIYEFYNSSQWSLNNHQLYLTVNSVNTDNRYNGTEYVSNWYKRN